MHKTGAVKGGNTQQLGPKTLSHTGKKGSCISKPPPPPVIGLGNFPLTQRSASEWLEEGLALKNALESVKQIDYYLGELNKNFVEVDSNDVKSIIKIANDYNATIFFTGSADAMVQAQGTINLDQYEQPNDFDITLVAEESKQQLLSNSLMENGFQNQAVPASLGFQLYKKGNVEIKLLTKYQPPNLAPFQNRTYVRDGSLESEWPEDSFFLFSNKEMALTPYSDDTELQNSNDNAAMRMLADIIQKGFNWSKSDLDNYALYLKGFFTHKRHGNYFANENFKEAKFKNMLMKWLKKYWHFPGKNLEGLRRVGGLMQIMCCHQHLSNYIGDINKILKTINEIEATLTHQLASFPSSGLQQYQPCAMFTEGGYLPYLAGDYQSVESDPRWPLALTGRSIGYSGQWAVGIGDQRSQHSQSSAGYPSRPGTSGSPPPDLFPHRRPFLEQPESPYTTAWHGVDPSSSSTDFWSYTPIHQIPEQWVTEQPQ